MFNSKYPFFTASSEYMKIHFSKYATFIKDNYLNNNNKIIEIGSNDGTFLENFKDSNLDFIVSFDQTVIVTNTPRIQVDVGGDLKYANYI